MHASLQRNISKTAIAEVRTAAFDGRSKGTYSSNVSCSSCRILFGKSHSLCTGWSFSKIPCCVIWHAHHSLVLLKWKQAWSFVQGCRLPLSLATEEMTLLHSHAKTAIKSPIQRRILFGLHRRCPAIQNTYISFMFTWQCGNCSTNPLQL